MAIKDPGSGQGGGGGGNSSWPEFADIATKTNLRARGLNTHPKFKYAFS